MWARIWPETCVGCGGAAGPVCATCAPTELRDLPDPIEGVAQGWFAEDYAGPLGVVIRQAKYRPDRRLGLRLAHHLALACRDHLDPGEIDVVIPVPSNRWSLFRRGFSLASLLTHDIGASLNRPVEEALTISGLRRQASLAQRERRDGLRGRVHTRRSIPPRVLLVDDVVTTGTTAKHCAQALLQEGAERVWIVAACLANRSSQTSVQKP